MSGENFAYANITSNTTTVIKSSAGRLVAITINKAGANPNTATVYDNTAGSGTVIATIDTTTTLRTLFFGCSFYTGLTIVTASGTAGDLTIIWE